jgi:CRP-like cAMP-binding protein
MSYIDTLRKAEYFKGLSDDDIRLVDRICHEESYDTGMPIFHEGDKAKNLYVVKKGRISIQIREAQAKPLVVCTISEGGAFGWSALVKPHVFTAGAICVEKGMVIVIDGGEMSNLCRTNTHLGAIVMENLAELVSSRLKNSREQRAIEKRPW